MRLLGKAESNLFTSEEVEDYRNAGAHFAPLAIRNLEAAIFPLFERSHFPHVNMLRECLAHVKGMSSVWSDCATTATTPIPFPYIQLAKIFTFIFLYTLPFALVEELEWMTMLAVLVLALGYFGLDAIGGCASSLFCRAFVRTTVLHSLMFWSFAPNQPDIPPHQIATEMEQPFGTDLNDLPMMEVVESIEKGSRVVLGQLEGEELTVYPVRQFFAVEGM